MLPPKVEMKSSDSSLIEHVDAAKCVVAAPVLSSDTVLDMGDPLDLDGVDWDFLLAELEKPSATQTNEIFDTAVTLARPESAASASEQTTKLPSHKAVPQATARQKAETPDISAQTDEVVWLGSSKKRARESDKTAEASTRSSKKRSTKKSYAQVQTHAVATASAAPKAQVTAEVQRRQLALHFAQSREALWSLRPVAKYEGVALPGNEKFLEIASLQWELLNLTMTAPPKARWPVRKSAKDFLHDEPDVLLLQLKVALVVLKKAIGDHEKLIKDDRDRKVAAAVAKRAKVVEDIKQKLVKDLQKATGDPSKTLDDLI